MNYLSTYVSVSAEICKPLRRLALEKSRLNMKEHIPGII